MERFSTMVMCMAVLFFSIGCEDGRNGAYEVPDLQFETEWNNGFVIPEGWEVTLWAESPDLYNPTNIDVDAKGRVWVTEAVNYRDFNNDPNNHLSFEKGDRVVILEDTDGDGVSDSSRVFVQDEDLTAPLGIAVFGDSVMVSCAPSLFMYTDTDGDDTPDKKETFLTGFGGFDHDHSLHSVTAGPDGKWYFNTGNAGPHQVTDKSGWTLRSGSVYTGGTPYNTSNTPALVSDDGNIWVGGLALRVAPDGTGLKVMAHNFRNAYEVALDSYGNLWQNDNDDQVETCRVTWLMEGGNAGYFNADGSRSWRADQHPGQEIFEAHWHQADPGVLPAGDNTGAGSPTGVVVYEGDAFGPEYRGMLLSADAGRNVIFAYQPRPEGAGFALERRDLIASTDESTEGYVWNDIDDDRRKWFRPSDIAVGTDGALYIADWYDPVVGGHQMMDSVGYGRIYRVAPKNKKLESPTLDLQHTKGQIAALLNPATNVRYSGFRALLAQGPDILDDLRPILESDNPFHRARVVWLMARLGDRGLELVEHHLEKDPDPRIRVAAFRALKQYGTTLKKYAAIAVDDPSPAVQREVAIAMRNLPWSESSETILTLFANYKGDDPWYLEALGMASFGKESEIYAEWVGSQPQNPADWSPSSIDLLWRLHPAEAIDVLKGHALFQANEATPNRRSLDGLAFIPHKEAVAAMANLAEEAKSDSIRRWAEWWLDHRKTNDWFALWDWQSDPETQFDLPADLADSEALLRNPDMSLEDRLSAGKKLADDTIGARVLISMAASNMLSEPVLRGLSDVIGNHPNQEIRTLGSPYFTIGRKSDLSMERIAAIQGEPDLGRTIFESKCAVCHKAGVMGKDIGPNLSSIGTKLDRRAVLQAIIDPNASIVFGYEPVTITTHGGQSFFGFLLSEGKTTQLKDMTGRQIVIPTDSISTKERSDTGMMPSAVNLGLTEEDLAHLTVFLETLRASSAR